MKLNRLDRLCIAAWAALNLMLVALMLACAVRPKLAELAGVAVRELLTRVFPLRVLLIVVSVLLPVLACSRVRQFARGRGESAAEAIDLGADGEGRVQISGAALEAVVRRSVGAIGGVDQYDVKLAQGENGLGVTLEARVRQGVKIPDLAQTARDNVRSALEEMAGVKVDQVALLVTEITAAQASFGRGKS